MHRNFFKSGITKAENIFRSPKNIIQIIIKSSKMREKLFLITYKNPVQHMLQCPI